MPHSVPLPTGAGGAGDILTGESTQHMVKHTRPSSGRPSTVRNVRLFRNGRNQAVRIPRDFEFDGAEAIMRREGDCLILEPVRKERSLDLLACLEPCRKRFPTSTPRSSRLTTWSREGGGPVPARHEHRVARREVSTGGGCVSDCRSRRIAGVHHHRGGGRIALRWGAKGSERLMPAGDSLTR